PMTPTGKKATTAPYGAVDPTFDACKLAEAAGATYVARSTAYHVPHLTDMIAGGLDNKGFSFIEAMVQCPTAFGRKNKMADPAKLMMWMRDNAVMKAAWDKLPEDKKTGDKFPIGLLYQDEGVDYATAYDHVIEVAGGAK
ncbi:MAG: 2-oxoglutarate ferredoxin oxidoreductase subunit beta, partial [Selenomonadaceae bacterium]|nr:2-oxoglutarate ferredoxin oxidoreductase subunit beta [Selenomonadaceae bacterium]